MESVKKQLKKLERKKKDEEYQYKTEGVKKQATFVTSVADWVQDDLKTVLESEYGPLPDRVVTVINAGESAIQERLHLLKIADSYGWGAVSEFTSIELARNDAEERKLKKIIKKNEERAEKVKGDKKEGAGWQTSNRRYSPRRGGESEYRKGTTDEDGSKTEQRKCYTCGKHGHLSKDCHSDRDRASGRGSGGRGRN